MLEKILRFFERYILPRPLYRAIQPFYHFTLAALANVFYGMPSKRMTVIGVTGTKGKTTTCSLIAQFLNTCGYKTGAMTTVSFRIGDREWPNETGRTTYGRFQLQKALARMRREGCRYAVIETSSEGILQSRHRFVDYDIAVFTNLGHEHLERHGSVEEYREAKLKLFKRVGRKKRGIGVYNLDDENARRFLAVPMHATYGFTLLPGRKREADTGLVLQVSHIKLYAGKTTFEVGNKVFTLALPGRFNVANVAAALCVGISQGIPINKLWDALKTVRPIPGRMERIDEGQSYTVFVDYAHTEESLRSVLEAAREIGKGRLIVVFGAGGDRDRAKRPKMGKAASELADEVVITSDNPRGEDPKEIMEDIARGAVKNNYHCMVDRADAIRYALRNAHESDTVIIAGKGHETEQVFKDKTIHFDDREVARSVVKEMQ